MTIATRQAKSLWSYNPIPRGCVLYLPLWALGGSVFNSIDLYGHSFTVTNALWRPQGLYFDGTGDYVKHTASQAFNYSLGTLLAWFKGADTAASILSSSDEGVGTTFLRCGIRAVVTAELAISQRDAGDTADVVYGDTAVNDNAWHMGAWVSTGTAYLLYLDSVIETTNVNAGADNGDWLSDTLLRDNIVIGNQETSAGVDQDPFTGTIGDVWLFNRALSQAEITYIYQRTKGRYL